MVTFRSTEAEGEPSRGLGSHLVGSIAPYGSSGWVKLDLGSDGRHHLDNGLNSLGFAISLNGLPRSGFMVYNVINANAQAGRLANYSGLFPQRTAFSGTVHSAGGE